MKRIPKQAYTVEFKELAVKRVTGGEAVEVVVKELGLADQTLQNWIKAAKDSKLKGAGSKTVTPEQMELSRLRAENARLKRVNDIIKKTLVWQLTIYAKINRAHLVRPSAVKRSRLEQLVIGLWTRQVSHSTALQALTSIYTRQIKTRITANVSGSQSVLYRHQVCR